jgi:putative peptidoglycan lipid II flippase
MSLAVAVAIVSFPAIARSATRGSTVEVRQAFERDLKLALLLIAPAIVMLMVFARPIVSLLFEGGSFGAGDARATSAVMQFYAPGLIGQVVIAVAVLPVYALGTRRTLPIRCAVAGLVVTAAVALAFLPWLDVRALALADAAGIMTMAGYLLFRLHRHVLRYDRRALVRHVARTSAAACVAAAAGVVVEQLASGFAPVPLLVIGTAAVAGAFFGAARLLGVEGVDDIFGPLGRRLRRAA